MTRIRFVAALSLLFTALFFIEYTPVLPRMRIPYDLEGFHYPLADYAFRALKQGRFPQWDPTTYCGLSFADNAQTAIYYPPMWLMFALKWGSAKLSYRALEYLALAHVWLAFVLCYAWLHGRRKLHWLASILGAGGFAFGGYMMEQLQHLGLLAAYAWLPLAFLSIDEAEQKRDWRPLWKLALASAMCLLGGYPPIWIVFAVCSAAYAFAPRGGMHPGADAGMHPGADAGMHPGVDAGARLGVGAGARPGVGAGARPAIGAGVHPSIGTGVRLGLWTSAALACSLLFCAVELLPALEAARLKVPEVKYSFTSGFKHPEYYLSYFIPNYFKFDLGVDPATTAFRDYLYLGGACLCGLALFLWRRKFRDAAPLLWVLLASLLFLVNPMGLPGWAIGNTPLSQVMVDWDFLAGVSAALAGLAALGLDFAFRRTTARAAPWSAVIGIAFAAAWAVRLIVLWNGRGVASGAKSARDAIAGTILCAALIYLYPRTEDRFRFAVAAALILLAAAEYKAFGTSKQFNGDPQKYFVSYIGTTYPAMDDETYAALQRRREYRWALEEYGPDPANLGHFGFATPQGFDPNLPANYKKLIDQIGHFQTNRLFDLNPGDVASLRLLGVGYVVGAKRSPDYARLLENPHFRLMRPDDSYYKVFELIDPQPPFGWEEDEPGRSASAIEWQPERRGLRVASPHGGVFRLSEQFYPGWSATLDGAPVEIERCHEAFQCVAVGPGEHLLEFRYRSRWLFPGAALSLTSMLLAMAFVRFRWRGKGRIPLPDGRGSETEKAGRRPGPPPINAFEAGGAGLRPAIETIHPAPPEARPSRDRQGAVVRYALTKAPRFAAAVLLAAFFWAFQGRALKSHFGPDEMMNIYGYWAPPLWKVLLANLAFWSNFVRPMAAVYYLPLFHMFKLNPVPYSWVRIGMLAVNTVLFYKLARTVSRSWWVAVLAAFPIAYQANLGNLSFDGAFIFDTLCGGFYFAALLYYIHRRTGKAPLTLKQGCVFLALYICALNSKEMAVSLPVVALAYELLLLERKGCGAPQPADENWFRAALRLARVPEKQAQGFADLARQLWPTLAAGAITAVFILGKALSPGSLTNMDAYRPVFTWARFSESSTRFLNTIFYADGITMEHVIVLWGVLLCAGIAGLSRKPIGTTEPVAAGSPPVSGVEEGRSGPVPLSRKPIGTTEPVAAGSPPVSGVEEGRSGPVPLSRKPIGPTEPVAAGSLPVSGVEEGRSGPVPLSRKPIGPTEPVAAGSLPVSGVEEGRSGPVPLARRRDPRWLFLWIWVMVTPLPIAFLPGRGAGLLYIVAGGWAMAAAMLCRAASWRLARELFLGRPARLAAMGLGLLGCAAAYAYQTRMVHREVVYGYLLTGKHTADMIGQFRKLGLQPKPGSRIVFLRDPFPDTFDMTFVAALAWNDRSLKIFQQSQVHLPADQVAGMDYILDYTGNQFVVVKTP